MKTALMLRILAALGVCAAMPALAGIYGYTAADGSVALSNVPTDRHYTLLMAEGGGEKSAAEGGESAPPRIVLPASKVLYEDMVDAVARKHGLESALLHAVISVESRYDAKAVSKKGAAGLMQLMPATAKRYKVDDALDPEQNLHGGARYLRYLLRLFDSDLPLALAAYNAGENAVIRNGNRIPPLKETMNYVPRVLGFYRRYLGSDGHAAARAIQVRSTGFSIAPANLRRPRQGESYEVRFAE